jgi:glutathione S-transferase
MARLVRAGPGALNWRPTGRLSKRAMSDEFDGMDATEKAGIEAALNRCRALAAQLESELRHKKPEHFVEKLSVADLCAPLVPSVQLFGASGANGS